MFYLISCKDEAKGTKINSIKDLQSQTEFFSENIKGLWYLNQWTLYHTLDFSKETVYVDNHIDSVFTLNYSFFNDTLYTWSPMTRKKFAYKIIKLTKDTFVLKGFYQCADTLCYSRIKKAWKN